MAINGTSILNRFTGSTIGFRGNVPAGPSVRRIRHSTPVLTRISTPPRSGAGTISPQSTTYSAPSGPNSQCEGRSNPSWGSTLAPPATLFTAKSSIWRFFMSMRPTLNPAGTIRRVVTGAASPKNATKASPSNPNDPSGQKSNPLLAAWGSNDRNGLGGSVSGGSAMTGSRPRPPSPHRWSSRRTLEA